MSLEKYREKRNFAATPEPLARRQARGAAKRPIFVVQKHEATRLHYDFRLEIGGVLASWAVPKGPSLSPADKRLAMRTEDHPIEYADFEGVIPEGQYGAGTVMVWDTGTFETEPDVDAAEQLADGELKFTLHGRKLNGAFVLLRSGLRGARARGGESWLLIKRKDEHAVRSWKIELHDGSALTGRAMEEIASGVRKSRRPRAKAAAPRSASSKRIRQPAR